jgi:ribosomal protein S18 acetylase RimI-like enzyme
MDIRRVETVELEEILAHAEASLNEGGAGLTPLSREQALALVQPLLDKGGYYLAAREGDELLGFILLGTHLDYFTKDEYGYIYEFYVMPEHRRKGLGKTLMDAALEDLRQAGHKEVRLNVFAQNPARHLYENTGFEVRNMVMSRPL